MEATIIIVLILVLVVIIVVLGRDRKADSMWRERLPVLDNRLRQAPSVDPEALWTPKGKEVNVSGYTIPGGMIYVGKGLRAANGYSLEAALIDPDLPVYRSGPDYHGSTMSYWPSYDRMMPQARAAYLEWLAQGRSNPQVYIGYVFLFFYGLERRLLVDAQESQVARSERGAIIGEVERLLALYSDNTSFQNYASQFLQVARLFLPTQQMQLTPPAEPRNWEYPLVLKLALAQYAVKGEPIPAEWALSWVEHHPQTWLRTPARRCRDEFVRLFAMRYHEKFGAGMIVEPTETPLRVEYRPASASFGGVSVKIEVEDRPDVTTVSGPVSKVREIALTCTNDLDAYSRYLGRNPHDKDSLTGLALLPQELLLEHHPQVLEPLVQWLSQTLEKQSFKTVDAKELMRRLSFHPSAKLSKTDCVSVAQLLSKLGHGMEPDIRFQEAKLDPEGRVVLFPLEEQSPATSTSAYRAAALITRLAALVASTDRQIAEGEKLYLGRHLESVLGLSRVERQRLNAYLQWLLSSPVDMTGIRSRLADLRPKDRESIAEFLITIANADGNIAPEEIHILKRIYGLLEIDPERLFSDIHRIQTKESDEPLTVLPGEADRSGYMIPSRPPSPSTKTKVGRVDLNLSLVEKTIRETQKVEAILTPIFAGSNDVDFASKVEVHRSGAPEEAPIAGLDSMHSKLVERLISQPSWERGTFESICRELHLLPDGAIENINNAVLRISGDVLIEEDEVIHINPEVAKELNT